MSNDPIEGHCLERYWGALFAVAQNLEPTSTHIRALVVHKPLYQLVDEHILLITVPESVRCDLQDVPPLAIEQALWSAAQCGETIDVTEFLMSRAGTSFFATNSYLGDPLPGKPKRLFIRLLIDHLPKWCLHGALGQYFVNTKLPTLLTPRFVATAQTGVTNCEQSIVA